MANCGNPLDRLDGEDIAGWRIASDDLLESMISNLTDGELLLMTCSSP